MHVFVLVSGEIIFCINFQMMKLRIKSPCYDNDIQFVNSKSREKRNTEKGLLSDLFHYLD